MSIYLICFILTLLSAAMNQRAASKPKPNLLLVFLTALPVILIPALVAGMRDFTVGTDVMEYGVPTFEAVRGVRLSKLRAVYGTKTFSGMIEPGYFLLAYFSTLLSNDPHMFLFLIALIIGVFTYLSLYRSREWCSIVVGEAVFLLLIYPESYNMMRQCLAMAMSLYGLTYLLERRYKPYFFWLFVAYLFHRSMVIALIYCPLYLIFERKRKLLRVPRLGVWKRLRERLSQIDLVKLSLFLAVSVLGLMLFGTVARILMEFHLLPAKYSKFVNGTETTSFSIHHMFDYAFMLVFLLLDTRKLKHKKMFYSMAILDVVLYMLRYRYFFMYRVSRYFMYCRVLSLGQIRFMRKRYILSVESLYSILMIAFCILYWVDVIAIGGYNDVFPYTSALLGIV